MNLTHFLYALLAVAVTVQLSSFATSIYLHRCMAHRGVKLNPVVAFFMRAELWLATGIKPKEWVAVHRKHHRHTDVLGDPHSPVLEGLWRILLGNAYYYAREARNPETLSRFAPDVGNDWFDRYLSVSACWASRRASASSSGCSARSGAARRSFRRRPSTFSLTP